MIERGALERSQHADTGRGSLAMSKPSVVHFPSGRHDALLDVLQIILVQRGIVSQGRRSVAACRELAGRIGQLSIDTMAAAIVTSAMAAHTALKT